MNNISKTKIIPTGLNTISHRFQPAVNNANTLSTLKRVEHKRG